MLPLPTLTAIDFAPLWPALILSAGACLVLLSEVFLSSASRSFQAPLTVASTVLAGVVAAGTAFSTPVDVFRGFAVLDPFGSLVSLLVCIGVGLSALLAPAFLRGRHAERGEFYALLLFAGAGMSLLGLSNELILLFINLEILSVATYALAAYLRRGPRPAEAGFKYFILGAFSSAVLLYGTSLLFGATRSTMLPAMASELARIFSDPMLADRRPLAYCGLALVGAVLRQLHAPGHRRRPLARNVRHVRGRRRPGHGLAGARRRRARTWGRGARRARVGGVKLGVAPGWGGKRGAAEHVQPLVSQVRRVQSGCHRGPPFAETATAKRCSSPQPPH